MHRTVELSLSSHGFRKLSLLRRRKTLIFAFKAGRRLTSLLRLAPLLESESLRYRSPWLAQTPRVCLHPHPGGFPETPVTRAIGTGVSLGLPPGWKTSFGRSRVLYADTLPSVCATLLLKVGVGERTQVAPSSE